MKQKWVSFGRMGAASVVMAALASPMWATVVQTYGDADRALFYGSLTPVVTANFNESLSNGTYQIYSGNYSPSALVTFLGATSPSADYNMKRISENGEQWLVGPYWTNGGVGDPRLEITLAAGAKAFGIDIASSVPGLTYQIVVDGDIASSAVASQAPGTTFFGVKADTNITHITIRMVSTSSSLPWSSGNNRPGCIETGLCNVSSPDESRFDNFIAGNFAEGPIDPGPPSETPETSTILYGATGLLLLAWTRHRRPFAR